MSLSPVARSLCGGTLSNTKDLRRPSARLPPSGPSRCSRLPGAARSPSRIRTRIPERTCGRCQPLRTGATARRHGRRDRWHPAVLRVCFDADRRGLRAQGLHRARLYGVPNRRDDRPARVQSVVAVLRGQDICNAGRSLRPAGWLHDAAAAHEIPDAEDLVQTDVAQINTRSIVLHSPIQPHIAAHL